MILYTVQVTGLQLRGPAPFNDLLLGLADIFYFLTPIFARIVQKMENDLLVHKR